jgi:hypothetical protein
MKKLVVPVLLSMSVLACKQNDDHDAHVHPNVQIHITSPTDSANVYYLDYLDIKAHVEADVVVHGYEIVLTKTDNNDTLFLQQEHLHSKEISIDTSYKHPVNESYDATLKINVILDHDNHTTSESRIVRFGKVV